MNDEATGWWPSPFGCDDQLGMLNHITDATRAQALRLVRSGRLYDLGRVLDERARVSGALLPPDARHHCTSR
jgi:hypothetical protein